MKTMDLFRLIPSLVVISLVALEPSQASSPSAREVWEAVIAAKGGHERLRQVRTFVISTGVTNSSHSELAPKLDIERIVMLSHGYWLWSDSRPGSFGVSVAVNSFSAHRYWNLWEGRTLKETVTTPDGDEWEAQQTIDEWSLTYFLETADLQPEPLAVKILDGGKVALDVKTARFAIVRFTVDLKTSVISDATFGPWIRDWRGVDPPHAMSEQVWTRVAFDGVVTVRGVQLPKRVKRGGTWSEPTYLVNPNLDPAMFKQAPESTAQGAWRKWLRPDGGSQ